MPAFSQRSLDVLETCDPRLQQLFNEVVKHFNCTIIVGARSKADQDAAVASGKSKLNWPESKHNLDPNRNPQYSLAVDVAPYPIDWKNTPEFYYFAGFVKGVASQLGISIRYGGDWNSDNIVGDQSFNDLDHFELADV